MSFKVGDKVIAKSGGVLYEAKVLETSDKGLKIHYKGWNARTDEVVDAADLLPFNAANQKKMRASQTKGKAPKRKAEPKAEPARKKTKSTYKVIKGKKYDRSMLDAADAAVSGKHDHVISVEESKEIVAAALDGGKYTDIEKATMSYIRENYKFTDAADAHVRKTVASWAAKKGQKKTEKKEKKEDPVPKSGVSIYKQIKGKKYDRGMLDAADAAVAGAHDNVISVDEAKRIVKEALDGNQYTDIEKDTMAYIRDNYKFTDAADKWVRHAVSSWAAKKAQTASGKAKTAQKKAEEKGAPKASGVSQYKVIKGKKYDRGMLDAADAAVAGAHDNVISLEESKLIIKEALDGNQYTDIEKATMHYIRDNYKFTDAADKHVRKAVASWAAKKAAAKN